ncbi:MAG TPA: ATP-binding cassette domain-containing protein, partial [Polyangiaceae bacterium]|nr:ATP-binding cassette domain-containing protein [Polyangiaceae bacterium]
MNTTRGICSLSEHVKSRHTLFAETFGRTHTMAKPPYSLPLVELCNVDFIVQQRKLLEDISLAVRPSEIWQIHGSAGTGKSILLELLLGRHRLSAGTRRYPAFIDESPDAAIGIPPRFALRLVSQDEQRRVASNQASFYQARWHSLWTEPLTIEGFLAKERVLGLREYEVLDCLPVRRDYDEERERCLVEMNLADRDRQLVGQLSNGELRKLLLIAAHLASPKVLLLDDPLGGLDPVSRECARKSILRWCNAGQTIVYCASYEDDLGPIATHHYQLDARAGTAERLEPAHACRRDLQLSTGVTDARGAGKHTPIHESNSTAPLRLSDLEQGERPQGEPDPRRVRPASAEVSSTPGNHNAAANRINPVIRCSKVHVSAGPQLLLDAVDWE